MKMNECGDEDGRKRKSSSRKGEVLCCGVPLAVWKEQVHDIAFPPRTHSIALVLQPGNFLLQYEVPNSQ